MNRVEEYVHGHDLQRRDAADVIEEFADEISRMRGTCLDIGCGPGTVTELVMPLLPPDAKVVGMDISQKMIDYAKKNYANEKRMSFVECNLESKVIPRHLVEAYDNAVSFYCLHWCFDLRKAFENIYQMLRPGGKCLVLFLAYNDGFGSYLRLGNNPRYKPYMKDVEKYIPYFYNCKNARASLKKILEESGFEVLHCSCREKTFVYQNFQILENHIRSINAVAERMPNDVREQFEKDMFDDVVNRKITFVDNENGPTNERKVLDRYNVLISYFKKPTVHASVNKLSIKDYDK